MTMDSFGGLAVPDIRDGLSVALRAEDGRTGDQSIGSSIQDKVGIVALDATINLDP
eukprot:CAMPEP_0196660560 /NCGR_PEP_ID=MMETSP1086-20130531/40357_1 /TAXON_ID=77921 /ORGANISM="Cyanoptyche  gloeocystis , Strain SAG4.97" /LENGTH=55 /DNA_ID=CAMNT_0041995035 /DNA_START=166 /DNA_END=330 /DNA_ORIENTATION=+